MSGLAERLVTANHVLANEGIIRGFGHVSAREPGSEAFLLSRARSPGVVELDDILAFTLNGEVVGDDVETYTETVIHESIYRARDDVGAVVHHHADEIMPFACSRTSCGRCSAVGRSSTKATLDAQSTTSTWGTSSRGRPRAGGWPRT